jgi:hypothetical protein
MLWNGNYEFKIRFYCLKQIIQCLLVKPCIGDTMWLLRRLAEGRSSSMTATFLNCQQNIFPEKVSETKSSVGYSLLRNSPCQVWGVSQKFSEKKGESDMEPRHSSDEII